MKNPYAGKPDYCFWSRSVSNCPVGELDPVISRSNLIDANDLVATMGSCFAQHIARHLQRSGLNYYVAEKPPSQMSHDEAIRRNYGVFSARYGNLYTVKQACQLFDRAFGRFTPSEKFWVHGSRFVDPFRPNIEPDSFASVEDVINSTTEHLNCVKEMFLTTNVVVLTLGLTEAWRSKLDGAIFPVAPGVNGGVYDHDLYEPVNFSAAEVISDLDEFVIKLRSVNSSVKFLLTVSPVPLIATHQNNHVVCSTTYSKSVLRVAAEEVANKYPKFVEYFPSYEIITSNHSRGQYFESDFRSVKEDGVAHVMRVFSKHYIHEAQTESFIPNTEIVCDEDVIEQALRDSGFK